MALVSRTKLNGIGKHFGVLLDYGSPAMGLVVDVQATEGVRAVPVGEFAQRRPVSVEAEFDEPLAVWNAWNRLSTIGQQSHGFDIIKGNCEHFARYVCWGNYESRQVKAATTLGGLALLLWLLSKAA
jgi:hypothetical protein